MAPFPESLQISLCEHFWSAEEEDKEKELTHLSQYFIIHLTLERR